MVSPPLDEAGCDAGAAAPTADDDEAPPASPKSSHPIRCTPSFHGKNRPGCKNRSSHAFFTASKSVFFVPLSVAL